MKSPDSAIKREKIKDLTNRYHGQMENALYALEQVCPRLTELKKKHFSVPQSELSCSLLDVPYECPMRDHNAYCKIPELRRLIGDNAQQHDIEIPENNIQADRKAMR